MAIVEEFAGLVGWKVDDSELVKNQQVVDKTEKSYVSFARVLQVAAAALSGVLLTSVNRTTTEMNQLSKSVFIATDTIGAIAQVASLAGFSFESVIDLAEELNNKLGESKGIEEMTAVKEATDILGLSFEKLNKQSPEEQFLAVLNAAKMLEDQQLAVSAADILLGAEANRIVGILREEEGTIEDLIARFRELNFLTEEGKEGATEFTRESGKLGDSLGSLSRQIFGLIGKALVPMLKLFNEVIAANKDAISEALLTFFENLNRILIVLAGSFGALLALRIPVLFALAATAVKGLALSFTTGLIPAIALFNASALLIPALIAAAVIAVGLLVEDLVVFFQGGDSALGRFLDKFPFLGEAARTLGAVFKEVFDGIIATFNFLFELPGKLFDAIAGFDFRAALPDFLNDFLNNITVTSLPTATQTTPEVATNLFRQVATGGGAINAGALGGGGAGQVTTPQGNFTTSSNSTSTIEQNINAPITIQQLPGESSQELAGRVSDGLGRQAANAVRQLNNGIER